MSARTRSWAGRSGATWNSSRTARIRVGTETFGVSISPTRTEFCGVLPRDVLAATIEKHFRQRRALL